EIRLELAQLVVEIGNRALDVRVLEADRFGALLHLARIEQRRERLGNVVEDPLAPFLLAFDRLPVLLDAARRVRLDVPEHVRVPAYELLVDQPRRRCKIPLALLLEREREEVDLEEQVPQLVQELLVVTRECSVRNLVRLLDGVRDDRARGLLAIPRAVAPQPLRQTLELEQGLLEALHVTSWRSTGPSTSSLCSRARSRTGSALFSGSTSSPASRSWLRPSAALRCRRRASCCSRGCGGCRGSPAGCTSTCCRCSTWRSRRR